MALLAKTLNINIEDLDKIIPHLPREIGRAACPILLIYRESSSIYGESGNNECLIVINYDNAI